MLYRPIVFGNESVQYFDKFYSAWILETCFLLVAREMRHDVLEFLHFFLKGFEFGDPSFEDGNDLEGIADVVLDTFLKEAGGEGVEIAGDIA